MSDSRWKDLYDHLKKNNFDVYSPGQKIGECTSPYLVIKNDGSNQHSSFSSDIDLYTIMCYVPKDNYSKLEIMIQSIKKVMKSLYPLFIPSGMQTSSYYDDNLKAHMISIQYKNYKKML